MSIMCHHICFVFFLAIFCTVDSVQSEECQALFSSLTQSTKVVVPLQDRIYDEHAVQINPEVKIEYLRQFPRELLNDEEFSKASIVLEKTGIAFLPVRIYDETTSYLALEIASEGDHWVSRFLKKVRYKNPKLRIFFFPQVLKGEFVIYNDALKGIGFGNEFIDILGDKENLDFVKMVLLHESRHAQFDYFRSQGKYWAYCGKLENLFSQSKRTYAKHLSFEESWNWRKDIHHLYIDYFKLKATHSLSFKILSLKQELMYRIDFSTSLSQRMLKSLKRVRSETENDISPRLVINTNTGISQLEAIFDPKKQGEDTLSFLLEILPFGTRIDSLSKREINEHMANIKNIIDLNIELIEEDLKYLNGVK